MSAVRTIYRWWAVVVFAGVLVQIGAAGYGAFYVAKRADDEGDTVTNKAFEHGWDFHTGFGYLVVLGMLILLALALLGRLRPPQIWWPLGLAVVGVLQTVWAEVGRSVPGLGFLHALTALVVFALAGLIVHRAWRKVRAIA